MEGSSTSRGARRNSGKAWGYNPVSIARFNQRFGRTGLPATTGSSWLQFRRDQVTSLGRKVYLHAAALKPQAKISADTICFAPGVTTASQWTNSAADYTDKLQDWRSWTEEGIIDLNIPMLYFDHVLYGSALPNWSTFAKNHQFNRHTALGPGISLNTVSNTFHQARTARRPAPSTTNTISAGAVTTVDLQLPIPVLPQVVTPRPVIQSIGFVDQTQVALAWSSTPGFRYRVEANGDANGGWWVEVSGLLEALQSSMSANGVVNPGTPFLQIGCLPPTSP